MKRTEISKKSCEEITPPVVSHDMPGLRLSKSRSISDFEVESIDLEVRCPSKKDCISLMDYLIKTSTKLKR